jgi:Cu(I)/Ag(I) efflux system membrane protein CusA/SilA
MWSHGAGADVMKRIATPMVGGVITSFVLELLIYPVIFAVWKEWGEVRPAMKHAEPVPVTATARIRPERR